MKQKSTLILILFLLFTVIFQLTGCEDPGKARTDTERSRLSALLRSRAIGKLSIMTYNVENLFDTVKDENRDDYSYLPLDVKKQLPDQAENCKKMGSEGFIKECLELDWNDKVLDKKIANIAETILTVGGIGPDILLLEEVENANSLSLLNKQGLSKAHYQTEVLLEGDDVRGIDVAVLSRLPLAGALAIHRIEFTPDPKKPDWKPLKTRGILEVPLLLPTGRTLFVFAFHMPSQSNPVQTRIDAIKTLNKILKSKGPGALAVAGGDSNVTREEEAKLQLQKKLMGQAWFISHLIGCDNCKGTQEHKKVWSFFDVLLFSPALVDMASKFILDPESIRIQKSGKHQLQPNGVPNRFDPSTGTGVSDHLPMYSEILRQP